MSYDETEQPSFLCNDCSVDCFIIGEYYMVHNHIWAQTGLGPDDGHLCISCIENRLNRKLSFKDFTLCALNWRNLFFITKSSDLLFSRLLSHTTKKNPFYKQYLNTIHEIDHQHSHTLLTSLTQIHIQPSPN